MFAKASVDCTFACRPTWRKNHFQHEGNFLLLVIIIIRRNHSLCLRNPMVTTAKATRHVVVLVESKFLAVIFFLFSPTSSSSLISTSIQQSANYEVSRPGHPSLVRRSELSMVARRPKNKHDAAYAEFTFARNPTI